MAQTLSALINAALADATVLGAGQTPSAANVAAVTPRIPPILADLQRRRVTPAIDTSAIPDYLFPNLVRVVVQHIASMFGGGVDAASLKAAEDLLKYAQRLDPTLDPIVLQIIENLFTQGGAGSVFDPDAVINRLSSCAASLAGRDIVVIPNILDPNPLIANDLAAYVAGDLMGGAQGVAIRQDAEMRLRRSQSPDPVYTTARVMYF